MTSIASPSKDQFILGSLAVSNLARSQMRIYLFGHSFLNISLYHVCRRAHFANIPFIMEISSNQPSNQTIKSAIESTVQPSRLDHGAKRSRFLKAIFLSYMMPWAEQAQGLLIIESLK